MLALSAMGSSPMMVSARLGRQSGVGSGPVYRSPLLSRTEAGDPLRLAWVPRSGADVKPLRGSSAALRPSG
jgi:hypothetical protein